MPQMCYYINVAARNADVAQSVERILGKDEVTSSNLVISSMNTDISWYKKTHRTRWVFCYTCKYAGNRRLFEFVLQEYTQRLVGGFFYGDSSYF